MPEYYSSGREPRRYNDDGRVREGISRSAARPSAQRPQGSRPQGARPQNRRPQGARPSGQRPPQGRRPAPRRRKKRINPLMIGIAVLVVIAVIVLIATLGSGRRGGTQTTVENTAQPTSIPVDVTQVQSADANGTAAQADPAADNTAATGDNTELQTLPAEERISVDDLSINTSLPDTWLNILLLGSDERVENEAARTDAMIICSINRETGAVKLTSIMRDTSVEITDAGKHNGTYRINDMNFYGGPEYAMKVVNEKLEMNIQDYVIVNFFGFQKIAQALGGIDVDITEAEMNEINKKAVDQAWIGYNAGIDESDQINEYLTTYGANTHLNGRQTLAYARVRSIDSDFARTERQRTVIKKLTEKLRGKSIVEITALAGELLSNVSTNMDFATILDIAMKVLDSGTTNMESMRLPVNNTYSQERRGDKDMFFDIDWKTNALELYNFIYE